MSRRTQLPVWPCAAAMGLLAGVLFVLPTVAAEPGPQDAQIRAQIEAGEFAPAIAAAKNAATVDKRDAWLAQIAAAQAEAGARDASLRTAAEIYDDRTRTHTLSGIAAQPLGGRGGGTQADFDSLMDLITATIEPNSWDAVGGPGSIAPFETGVRVDAQGLLQPLLRREVTGSLATLRAAGATGAKGSAASAGSADVWRSSPLRKISLTRLEKHVQLRLAAGRPPTEAMQVLAGLQRIQYVFVYPESGDIVLAGPAGNWYTDLENRIVSTESGQPVLRLDDLVVVLRQMTGGGDTKFGCLIVPRQEALARLKAFLNQPGRKFQAGARKEWVEQLRSRLGRQDVEVYGLDPRTRAARVLVEADYRMKLVGMGLEEGVPGVESYLDLIDVRAGQAPPPMGVLRWWFTLNYQAVLATHDRQAFAIRGQGVKVLSENELLTAEGKRVHTGESEPLNRQFAQSFTEHFEALCEKYPVYADLRNICDLALVGALIRAEDLPGKIGWHMTFFGDPQAYQVELGPAPKEVETVANYRVIRAGDKIHTIAGVSGGVRVDPAGLVKPQAIEIEGYGPLSTRHGTAEPEELPLGAWWWD
jgi:hypothetical protein